MRSAAAKLEMAISRRKTFARWNEMVQKGDLPKLVDGGVAAQSDRVLRNVQAVLQAGGAELTDVVKTTVFLTDMNDFAAMNAVYAEAFGDHRNLDDDVAVQLGEPAAFFEWGLAVSQGAAAVRGRTLRVSAAMGATGGARAVLGLAVLRRGGDGQRQQQAQGGQQQVQDTAHREGRIEEEEMRTILILGGANYDRPGHVPELARLHRALHARRHRYRRRRSMRRVLSLTGSNSHSSAPHW